MHCDFSFNNPKIICVQFKYDNANNNMNDRNNL